VLALGVNAYEMGRLKLNLAVADATSLMAAFGETAGKKALYSEVDRSRIVPLRSGDEYLELYHRGP